MNVETRLRELLAENRKQDADKLARAVINSHGVESVGLRSSTQNVIIQSGGFVGKHNWEVVDGEVVVDENGVYILEDGDFDFEVQLHSFPNGEGERPIRAVKTLVEENPRSDSNETDDNLSSASADSGRAARFFNQLRSILVR